MKKRITTIIAIALSIVLSGANAYSQTLDKIYPVINTMSNSILFLNMETGELISVAVFDQPTYSAVINEEGVFYAISKNYMYKGDLKSGDILDKYQHTERIEKTAYDYTDPNLFIAPRGVTPDGYALIDFNSRKLEATRNMKKYSDKLTKAEGDAVFDIAAASEQNNKVFEKESKTLELYLIDFNKKSKTHYGAFNTNEVLVGGISQGEIISLYDIGKHEWTYKNVISGKETKKISYSGFFAKHPEIASFEIWYAPSYAESGITKCGFKDTTNKKFINIVFNSNTNEILTREDIDFAAQASQAGWLTYQNTESIYFGNVECDIPPFPKMQELPEMEGTSKKKREEYMNKVKKIQEDYKKETTDYMDKIKHKENFCTLTVFKDKEKTKKLITIPRANKGIIINNDKILIRRANEVVLYNLTTGAEVWKTDTNF